MTIEFIDETDDVFGIDEVDEAIANIALVLEVDGKIEEVVGSAMVHVDFFEKHALSVFVGNVSHLMLNMSK